MSLIRIAEIKKYHTYEAYLKISSYDMIKISADTSLLMLKIHSLYLVVLSIFSYCAQYWYEFLKYVITQLNKQFGDDIDSFSSEKVLYLKILRNLKDICWFCFAKAREIFQSFKAQIHLRSQQKAVKNAKRLAVLT